MGGFSTSLPPEIQMKIMKTIPGCEEAEILRFGYAIEYDMVPPHQIEMTLQTRRVPGLYLAGQINGTSGYEEAAGQGLLAGINAALKSQGEPPFMLGRDEAYLGVMMDDLVTKDIKEPYRLFTSRSEYRLLLRQDNADRRLMKHARRLGLLDAPVCDRVQQKEEEIEQGTAHMKRKRPKGEAKTWWELLRQQGATLESLRTHGLALTCSPASEEALEIEAKYEGYLERQVLQVNRLRELEEKVIPKAITYDAVPGLGNEAIEKLTRHRPHTYGQALRIDGITPSDISIISVFLAGGSRRKRRQLNKST